MWAQTVVTLAANRSISDAGIPPVETEVVRCGEARYLKHHLRTSQIGLMETDLCLSQ